MQRISKTAGPRLFLEQLISLTMNRLYQGSPVWLRTELAANAAEVHVDAAVVACMRAAQSTQGQVALADGRADMAKQHLEQTEFGAGQRQGRTQPFGTPLFGP